MESRSNETNSIHLFLKNSRKVMKRHAASKEAQKQSDIEAKKFSAEQVAELREIAEVSGFAASQYNKSTKRTRPRMI